MCRKWQDEHPQHYGKKSTTEGGQNSGNRQAFPLLTVDNVSNSVEKGRCVRSPVQVHRLFAWCPRRIQSKFTGLFLFPSTAAPSYARSVMGCGVEARMGARATGITGESTA